jgi:hypothetical protein
VTDDDPGLIDALTTVIAQREGVEGALVTNFVVVASFIDRNGENSIYTETPPTQRCHETLGLLSFGLALENRRAVTGEDGDE